MERKQKDALQMIDLNGQRTETETILPPLAKPETKQTQQHKSNKDRNKLGSFHEQKRKTKPSDHKHWE
jgi:hypothetical protein